LNRQPGLFKKVLVANRGEIAIRVSRALREMEIESVCVFSEADRLSSHIAFADEAYPIGPAPPTQSYLNIERIIDTAKKSGCQAIHPGYGFLAESHEFARACEDHGITFIGPGSESIRQMGLKTQARKIMKGSDVPVIPGIEEPLSSEEEAVTLAGELGYPVIIKASAGGGGKGMRIVRAAEEMKQAFKTARNEAESAFGNPATYLEKYINRPRHIEVQILADNYGNMVYLGERECSIQRRYQKLIEESPSPAIDSEKRKQLGETAVKAAQAAGYRNAGTVEFIFDQSGSFYFLEVNTRLQVEHPVTELTTGIDLVKEQIRIASGFPLDIKQDDIRPKGAAIECRIYAEDPSNDFLPSLGKISRLRNPAGPWVRMDSCVYEGYNVPVYYDPLIAKLITWGQTRSEALERMNRALEEYVIEGIETTIPFHIWVIRDDNFRKGDFSTSYIDEHYTGRPTDQHRKIPADVALIAAAISRAESTGTARVKPRQSTGRWRDVSRREGVS
jgi:acetyl-CoA carboxylase biotin carboxylase subunit